MIFDELKERIQWAITKEGFTAPTPIQEKAIPIILQKKDVIGIAQTGTGKTASFVLPIIQMIASDDKPLEKKSPRVLVISPTRELVTQIDDAFETYGKNLIIKHKAIHGGVSQEPQIKAIHKGLHVLVATPGRLIDLISQEKVDLSKVEYFVVDEAHIMLDMGFIDSIKEIYKQLSPNRQSLFFTATSSPKILSLANELLNNPITVEVESEKASDLITQKVYFQYVDTKNALLLELLPNTKKTIIFSRTRYKADAIAEFLNKNKIKATSIHKLKSQEERTKTISDFKNGKIKVLVATDIAARGIHIDDISHVINYDTPSSPDVYVHRIGRTARAGNKGTACTFCSLEERELLRNIEKYTGTEMKVIKHTFFAEKVQNASAADIVAKPKRKKGSATISVQKRQKNSDVYVPPINKKKNKKARGINKVRNSRRQ